VADFTYDEASERLIEAVPEIREAYEKELAWWKGEKPGQFIIYEDIFKPYLISLLFSADEPERLRAIFEFLETLAASPDQDVRNLLYVAICEVLVAEDALLSAARQYAGPATLDMLRDAKAARER
jgi:hypothetical protein